MDRGSSVLAGRHSPILFWAGTFAVSAGVLLHLPMFFASAPMHYMMAGMPMDPWMIFGMFLIVGGVAVAGYGLLPPKRVRDPEETEEIFIEAASEGELSPAHWILMATLTIGLVIDTMKPATLGLLLPGMMAEYNLPHTTIALFPLSALTGLVVGSIVWGYLADIYGRRAAILLSAVMFAGTSICGFMPSFGWNMLMCFLMGASAGGMLPVCYALLTEAVPAKHRGWILVLVGGLGTVGGFLTATGSSAILQPEFGWRIMWFLGLPTGLLLAALNRFIPESAKFLILQGHAEEAAAIMRHFGSVVRTKSRAISLVRSPDSGLSLIASLKYLGTTAALVLTGIGWGLLNFGLLLWLPASLEAKGFDILMTSELLAKSAFIALPVMFLAAYAYSQWSTKWSLVAMLAICAAGLLGLLQMDTALFAGFDNPVVYMALLVIGANGIVATILPYAAENYPLHVRGRATGVVAASTKMGGMGAQIIAALGVYPSLATTSLALMVPVVGAILLIGYFGRETRGVVLRDVDFTDAAWG